MNNTILEVNINKFLNNIEKIKNYCPNKEIMPVIKANAYGTYLNKRLDILNHFNIVAVAKVKEAIEIRKTGYEKEIFVLNQPLIEELDEIANQNITIGLSEIEFLKKVNKPIKVHLEIETGMNRTGIQLEYLNSFIEEIKKNKNIIVEGIYTHFSSADNDFEYTNKQFKLFQKAKEEVEKNFSLKYIHCSASNGILNVKEDVTNMIRPGLLIYGYEPFPKAKDKIPVEEITELKTKMTYIKELDENESISYNRKYQTEKKMKVATIPIGYADGLRRELTNIGEVFVKGEKRKILGSICMDSCVIDVTDLDVKVGDTVIIWDNKNITVEEIAQKCNTISYEILSTISERVERYFKEDKKIS